MSHEKILVVDDKLAPRHVYGTLFSHSGYSLENLSALEQIETSSELGKLTTETVCSGSNIQYGFVSIVSTAHMV